jgi:Flp pilus assembly pilin Flp
MLKKFLHDETGLELSEYALAAALVCLAVAGVFAMLGDAIKDKIDVLSADINSK